MERVEAKKLELLRKLPKDKRKAITKNEFGYFLVHYFPHYIQYLFSSFHYSMMQDLMDLLAGDIKECAWFQFRESAKTSFAKIFIIYCVCFELDDYINVDSYDKENAERILFDVVLEFQTNKRLIEDFGEIYNIKQSKFLANQKRINNFVTNPIKDEQGNIVSQGIRVEAHSTQEPVRGRLHGAKRPGLVIVDDFETIKTIRSEIATENIRQHLQEFKGGLDTTRGRVLYLGNYLSEFANIQSVIERSKIDPSLRIRIVPIQDEENNPTWPEKYCNTDIEAKEERKVSIEEIKRRMWTPEHGDDDYMAEMMCMPIDYSNSEFKKEWFDENRYYEPDLDGKSIYNFITFDNAPSTNENSDWIGCMVASVDIEDIWYFRYIKRYRLKAPDLIDEMYRLNSIYHPKVVGFEQKAFDDLIKPYIEKRGKELKQIMYVVELKDKGIRKEDRIRGRLVGRFATGRAKIKKYATDDTNEFVKEAAQFPNGRHDDLLDAAQYMAEIAYSPSKLDEDKPTEYREIIKQDIQNAFSAYEKQKKEVPDTI